MLSRPRLLQPRLGGAPVENRHLAEEAIPLQDVFQKRARIIDPGRYGAPGHAALARGGLEDLVEVALVAEAARADHALFLAAERFEPPVHERGHRGRPPKQENARVE